MEKVIINGVEYQPVHSGDWKTAIIVCDRGFVLVGEIKIENNYVTIRKCQNVRRWGTTRGLGQIASEGPTAETKIDPQPTTRVHELQVVQIIDCEAAKWNL